MKCITELRAISGKVTIIGSREVPWFPTHIEDFNHIGKTCLGPNEGIGDVDHPGFHD